MMKVTLGTLKFRSESLPVGVLSSPGLDTKATKVWQLLLKWPVARDAIKETPHAILACRKRLAEPFACSMLKL